MAHTYHKNRSSLFFDMDGTLWDGVTAYANGFNDYFKRNTIDRSLCADDIKQFMGYEEQQFLAEVLPELNQKHRVEAYQEIIDFQYQHILNGDGILYDGVRDGIAQLSEYYNLFVVSNCPKYTIDYFLKWAELEDCFVDTMAHGQNHQPKHQNILLLKDKYQIKEAHYIGDTDSDRKQSTLVHMPFVFVDYGFGECSEYNHKFSSFDDLLRYFDEKVHS